MLVAAGKKGEADALARKWIDDHPNDVAFQSYLAEQALRDRDFKQAATQYQAVLAKQPDNVTALNNLAWALGQQGDPKALGYAERALKLAPESPLVLDTVGVLYTSRGDAAKGVEYLTRAVALAPQRHDIRLNYAKALLKAGRTDDARKELEQLQKVSQDFPGKSEVAVLLKSSNDSREEEKGSTVIMGVIGVVGLGYVGLPLAVEFGKKVPTVGFDLMQEKVDAYRRHVDPTGEVSSEDLKAARLLDATTDPTRLREADFIIVAVPTPIDAAHQPDFSPLVGASITVGRHMKKGTTVVYESTVYPGATEEVCIPLLERESGLKWKQDFFVGYSPERINPGDREHTLTRIVKVVSGDTAETLERVARTYETVITAGVHRASSIKVAEAAKVIENTQRDLNIALMNELALIFHRIGIDTMEVLQAAGTKWNFLPFRPGLVGGHCIGVDPYYLTHKADMLGYHPQVILAGRRINDGMGHFVAEQTVKQLIQAGLQVKDADVIVLGLTFKENCPDLRNSRVIDIVRELESFGARVSVHDPLADAAEAMHEYGVRLSSWDELPQGCAIVAAVAHDEYRRRPVDDFVGKLRPGGLYVDVKCQADAQQLRSRGLHVWRL